ncbi:FlaA1/EpsC-like NDP-sugar epimerase [Clostridium moniliforme]|uniref:FlaA1/EpsC-like NDP-sugar epimerase n=1 Tax=Clostridium moniliforme TaxID=39489 RepID=A0ABS4EYB7_9CLOT|nr:hypothetical protein [Clostridium moniliforme]MBP1888842.1 FlaA1/EpsC-like NDP-sugar epimerase [Clostridium moniliforme]
MAGVLFTILQFIIMLAIIFGLYILCKKYVFTKIRINKFIPLAIAIILLVIQMTGIVKIQWVSLIMTPIIVVLFLWFLDIQQTGGPKVEKKIVIKSKAKPNRAKHMKDKNPK